jgi:hypothetical protein
MVEDVWPIQNDVLAPHAADGMKVPVFDYKAAAKYVEVADGAPLLRDVGADDDAASERGDEIASGMVRANAAKIPEGGGERKVYVCKGKGYVCKTGGDSG